MSDDKDEKSDQLVRQERQGIERRNTDLFRRGLEMLDRKKAQEFPKVPDRGRREFTFTTVTLDEFGEEIERRTGRAWEVIEDLGGGVELELVEIPGGEFWMGSTAEEIELAYEDLVRHWGGERADLEEEKTRWERFGCEKPRHLVRVSPFFLGKYPVTQGQWKEVMGFLPEIVEDLFCGNNCPIVFVSWEEAVEFCRRLSYRTGHEYRLPSEAEWEYAARAGTTTPFAFGETITPEVVNYAGNYPYGFGPKGRDISEAVDVGSLGVANAFGLFDMHGNVWEWCEDDWHDSYEGAPADGRAWVDRPDRGALRVDRGGGDSNCAVFCRSATRDGVSRGFHAHDIGFRILRTLR
ncbi:MAG: formylglycine-generating enzyme family protein [Blastocatellia bacterium]